MNLYKYVTAERIDVLQNSMIRFTQPSGLNDPFDLKILADDLFSKSMWKSFEIEVEDSVEDGRFAAQIYERMKGEIFSRLGPDKVKAWQDNAAAKLDELLLQVAQKFVESDVATVVNKRTFDMLREVTQSMAKQNFSSITSKLGVLSLTENSDNLLMWSHYAASHKGFVIELDSENNFFKFPKDPNRSAVEKVEYVERRKLQALVPEDDNGNPFRPFFLKSKYWSYENEWRLIRPLVDANKVYQDEQNGDIHLFRLPPDAVTGVILGLNVKSSYKEALIHLIQKDERYKHVKLLQASPNYEEDRVNILPI